MNPYLPPADASHFPNPAGGGASVTELTVEMLRQTKPWVQLIGVLSLVGAGFMALGAVSMLAMAAVGPRGSGFSGAIGLVYLPFAALYIYPGIKLWKYGSAINRLMMSRDQGDLELALEQQKSFWKFSGISLIVLVILYVLIFAFALIGGVMAATLRH